MNDVAPHLLSLVSFVLAANGQKENVDTLMCARSSTTFGNAGTNCVSGEEEEEDEENWGWRLEKQSAEKHLKR